MVEAIETGEDLPIVLIVHTESTKESQGKLVDALVLKQGECIDSASLTWQIVTNYYKAKVKLEMFEVPNEPPSLLSG